MKDELEVKIEWPRGSSSAPQICYAVELDVEVEADGHHSESRSDARKPVIANPNFPSRLDAPSIAAFRFCQGRISSPPPFMHL